MKKYSDEDLALAYELRQEGCCWKLIGLGLGIDHELLRQALAWRCGGRNAS